MFSILSLSGPLSGEPDRVSPHALVSFNKYMPPPLLFRRGHIFFEWNKCLWVSQMIVLIKTVSNTNSSLFCLSVIYIQKSLKRWKNDFFADTEKISGLNSIYFYAKTILFGDYFLAHFRLWSIIHSNRTHFIFSWTMNVTSFSPFLKFVHILWITRIIWKFIQLKLQYHLHIL